MIRTKKGAQNSCLEFGSAFACYLTTWGTLVRQVKKPLSVGAVLDNRKGQGWQYAKESSESGQAGPAHRTLMYRVQQHERQQLLLVFIATPLPTIYSVCAK
jgi:hypothetical protein